MSGTTIDVISIHDDSTTDSAIRAVTAFDITKNQKVFLNFEFPIPADMEVNDDDFAVAVFQNNAEYGDEGVISIGPLQSSYTWGDLRAGKLASQATYALKTASSVKAIFSMSGPAMNYFGDYNSILLVGGSKFVAKFNAITSHFT